MATCDELKKGSTLVCEECGLELQVMKECKDCASGSATCSLESCSFKCHGKPLKVKKAAAAKR